MDRVKQLIHEIHRRSLWQVTGIFLAASWGVLQVVEVLTETAGLPDWTPSMALVLLLIGLPMCLATAFVQEGMPSPGEPDASGVAGPGRGAAGAGADAAAAAGDAPGGARGAEDEQPMVNLAAGTGSLDRPTTRPSATRRLLTWRNAALGGLGAFTILGFSLVAYFVMWTTGIGPVGNLVAQGVIEEGDRVVLATFSDATGEGLGEVVTEALRVDLSSARVLDLVDQAELEPTLRRMQVDPALPLSAEVAREVALRDGIGAVIDGTVATAGGGYLVTATLREASSGRTLAAFRAAATDPDDVIRTIDKLSQDIREKSGESLRAIKAGEPLEQVTTASLDALRLYTEARSSFGLDQEERVIDLLNQAVTIDSTFAMGWRLLSSAYSNYDRDPIRMMAAAEKAFQHRERLTERERYLTEAAYYLNVLRDLPRSIVAYENVLRLDPTNVTALNNVSTIYNRVGEIEKGNEMLRRAAATDNPSPTVFSNLVYSELYQGRIEGAAQVVAEWEAMYPDASGLEAARYFVALVAGATEEAREIARRVASDPSLAGADRADGSMQMAKAAFREGRLTEARQWLDRGPELAAQAGPTARWAYTVFGAVFETMLGDATLARRRLESAMASGQYESLPPEGRFDSVLSWAYALLGDVEAAARHSNAALTTNQAGRGPDAVEIDEALTRLVARAVAGDTVGVNTEVAAVRRRSACQTDLCYRMERAVIAMHTGADATAIALFESLASSNTGPPPYIGVADMWAMLSLGPLYERAGRRDDAIAAYQRVVEMWSDGDEQGRVTVRDFGARIRALQNQGD